MLPSLALTPQHGYVVVAVGVTYIVHHIYMAGGVMKARKQYKVSYPALYADSSNKNAKEFNCVQRGHQNCLENLPSFYALLLTAGIRYPISAAIAAALYNIGRIMYFKGYCTGNPEGRMRGSVLYLGILGLLGMAGKFAFELLTAAA